MIAKGEKEEIIPHSSNLLMNAIEDSVREYESLPDLVKMGGANEKTFKDLVKTYTIKEIEDLYGVEMED